MLRSAKTSSYSVYIVGVMRHSDARASARSRKGSHRATTSHRSSRRYPWAFKREIVPHPTIASRTRSMPRLTTL